MTPTSLASIGLAIETSRLRIEKLAPSHPGADAIARLLARVGRRIASPPRVVLLGDFNSGKSTLANGLIGRDALPTSIHANTRVPLHAVYAGTPSITLELRSGERVPLEPGNLALLQTGGVVMLHVGLPAPRLQTFELIDTPGLAQGTVRPDRPVLDAARRAHIAVWCTAATQAWKATEAMAWNALPERLRRRSLLVVTLADALNTDRDRARLEARLRSEAEPEFSSLVLIAASEVEALRRDPTAPDHHERWQASGGAALDSALDKLVEEICDERRIATERILRRALGRIDSQPHASKVA